MTRIRNDEFPIREIREIRGENPREKEGFLQIAGQGGGVGIQDRGGLNQAAEFEDSALSIFYLHPMLA
jgi:hypothetical protein